MEKQKSIYREWWFYLMVLVFVGLVWILIPSGGTGVETGLDTFAECLTASGAVMYGTDWCPHCKAQKEMFGKSFEKVNFVNCDFNKEECLRNLVEGYPTWRIKEQNYGGTQSLVALAEASGCELTRDG